MSHFVRKLNNLAPDQRIALTHVAHRQTIENGLHCLKERKSSENLLWHIICNSSSRPNNYNSTMKTDREIICMAEWCFGKHTQVYVYDVLQSTGYVQIWNISSISYSQLQSVSLPAGISLFHGMMKSIFCFEENSGVYTTLTHAGLSGVLSERPLWFRRANLEQ